MDCAARPIRERRDAQDDGARNCRGGIDGVAANRGTRPRLRFSAVLGARRAEAAPATPRLQVPPRWRLGKHRPFRSRHFGHFDHRGFVFKFGHTPPSSRGTSGTSARGLVLKFGDFVLRFGHVPHFKDRHFGRRHHHHWLFFGFEQPRRFRSGTIAALPLRIGVSFTPSARACRSSHGGRGGGLHGGAPPEALLEQLEADGFSIRARASARRDR